VTAAWMAGVSRMRWWTFFLWNAAGGVCWALLVGLVAYLFGQAAADAIAKYGLIGGASSVALALAGLVGIHFWRKRLVESP
jgi:membrane protein DedA with SNARE-associated domain